MKLCWICIGLYISANKRLKLEIIEFNTYSVDIVCTTTLVSNRLPLLLKPGESSHIAAESECTLNNRYDDSTPTEIANCLLIPERKATQEL